MINIAINGFGRIGRSLLRVIFDRKSNLKVKVINDINLTNLSDSEYLENLIYLLKNDSIYGVFKEKLAIKKNILEIGSQKIHLFLTKIENINCNKFNINTIVDSSGANISYKSIQKSIQGNKKFLITNNYKDADITLVKGVNDHEFNYLKHNVISVSTCTGQAFLPFAKIINDNFIIENGFVTTIHPSLSDDLVMDGSKRPFQYGRAFKNVRLLPTNVVKSAIKVIPDLKNKLFEKSLSYRVPTDIVSSVLGVIKVKKKISSKKDIIKLIDKNSNNIRLCKGFFDRPLVSSDYIRSIHPCILSEEWLDVSNNDMIRFQIWHDNEFAYCNQIYETIKYVNQK